MPSLRRIAATALFIGTACLATPSVAQGTYTVARALSYQNAKDWRGLLSYATAWSQAQPGSIDAWAFIGAAYEQGLGQPDKAVAALKHCVVIDPNSAPAWHALGTAYVGAKQWGPAVDAIKRAIQLNPNQPTYYNNLAAAYSGGNAVASAMAALDQEAGLAKRLNNATVWYTLGNGYAQLSDLKNAIAAYRSAVAIQPGLAQGWTNLGVVLQYNGDTAGARSAYGRGSQLGDPLAGKDAAQMEADLRAQSAQQAQQQSDIQRGMSATHMLYFMNH